VSYLQRKSQNEKEIDVWGSLKSSDIWRCEREDLWIDYMFKGAKANIFQAIFTTINGEHDAHKDSLVSIYCYGGCPTNNKGGHR
jgi:hypothetical protein